MARSAGITPRGARISKEMLLASRPSNPARIGRLTRPTEATAVVDDDSMSRREQRRRLLLPRGSAQRPAVNEDDRQSRSVVFSAQQKRSSASRVTDGCRRTTGAFQPDRARGKPQQAHCREPPTAPQAAQRSKSPDTGVRTSQSQTASPVDGRGSRGPPESYAGLIGQPSGRWP